MKRSVESILWISEYNSHLIKEFADSDFPETNENVSSVLRNRL